MLEVRKKAGGDIPGLEQILRADAEDGYFRFYAHYHPIVTAMVRRAGIVATLEGTASSQEVAHDIIAKFVTNASTSITGLRKADDVTMKSCFKTAVENQHATSITNQVKYRKRWGYPQPDIDEQGVQSFNEEDIVAGYVRSRSPRPDELLELKDLEQHLSELRKKLPESYSRILRMLKVGMSQPEIARAMDVSLSSVGNRVKRARASARKLLKAMNPHLSEELFS